MMYQLDPNANQQTFVDPFVDADKAGAKRWDLSVKEGESVLFRILPAFAPNDLQENQDGSVVSSNPHSWVPFRDPNTGGHFCWARYVHLVSGVGYGSWRDREDFILPKTFEHRTGDSQCAYTALYYKAKNSADWKYLTEDSLDPQGKRVSPVLPYPKQQLFAVVYEPGDVRKRGVYIATLPKSASNTMFDDNGICNALNLQWNNSMDPMHRWAAGDITNPETGPVLMLTRKKSNTGMSLYHINPAPAQDGMGIQRWPISADLLAKRPVLSNDAMFKAKDNQEIVKILASRLTGTSPFGHKEYGLLRETFGDSYELPEPPAAGPQQTFSGFNAPQAMPPGQGAPQPGVQQFPGPQAGGPPIPPPQGMTPAPQAADDIPYDFNKQAQTPAAPAPSGFNAPPPSPGIPQQPAAPIAGQPMAATEQPAAPAAPAPPAPTGPATHGAVPSAPEAPAAPQAPAQPQQPAAPVPGQATGFDRDSFMKEIGGQG